MKIKITTRQASQRLDKFLSNEILKISRNQVQKIIKQNKVLVNNKDTTSHYMLKAGDDIKIKKNSEVLQPTSSQIIKTKQQILSHPKMQYLADTNEYFVINKPAGLIVHGAPYIKETTLVDFLVKKYPDIKKVGEDSDRPGIVHRLDKDVSGLIVIAKTQECFNNLKEQFQKRIIKKEYTSLVHGQINKDEDIINFPLKRSRSGYKMSAVPFTAKVNKFISDEKTQELKKTFANAKQAFTHFDVIKRFVNYTLLKIKNKTGRTHQIRAHLAAYNRPIVGDNLYGAKKIHIKNEKLNFQRIFLVADKLSFYDLSGKKQTFKINLPQELKNFLEKIF